MIDIYAVKPENEVLARRSLVTVEKVIYLKVEDRFGTANLCFVEVRPGTDVWALPGGRRVLGRENAERIGYRLASELGCF